MDDKKSVAERIVANIEKVIVGKRAEVELALMALAAGGHLLIEDIPGVGKTMLARSLAHSTGCTFGRIQFTPDLLPGDITGVSIYNQKTAEFEFRAGPIAGQVILADEINRATPKTQSALLEAMEERQFTVDGTTHRLPQPFMVMATQNPIEYEGTFPLPEAQLDRFLVRLSLGYPAPEDEVLILERHMESRPVEHLEQVCVAEDVLDLQAACNEVFVHQAIKQFIVNLADATRHHESVYLGASPRGSLALQRLGQARAHLQERDFVLPEDIKYLAYPALGHRIIISPTARVRGVTAAQVVEECLERVPMPGIRAR